MRRIPALLIAAGLAAAPASAAAGPSSDPWSSESTEVATPPIPEPLISLARALWSPLHGLFATPPPSSAPPPWLRTVLETVQHPKPQPSRALDKLRSLFGIEPAGPVCRAP